MVTEAAMVMMPQLVLQLLQPLPQPLDAVQGLKWATAFVYCAQI